MSESPLLRMQAVLDEAAKTDRLPIRSEARYAQLIRDRRDLREAAEDLVEFHRGHADEHHRLIALVSALLETVTPKHNGHVEPWWTAVPEGTAPAFRRAVNALVKHLRGNDG